MQSVDKRKLSTGDVSYRALGVTRNTVTPQGHRSSDEPAHHSQEQSVAEPQRPVAPADASTGELVGRLSQQMSTLVRDEIRLAQLDLTEKGKRVGVGAGAFGGAGAIAYLGLATLVAAAGLGL